MKALLYLLTAVSCFAEIYVGSGDVMDPTFANGQVVEVSPAKFDELQPRMAVALTYSNRKDLNVTVASRLVALGSEGWTTVPDANNRVDPWIVTKQNFVGVVARRDGPLKKRESVPGSLRTFYVLRPFAVYIPDVITDTLTRSTPGQSVADTGETLYLSIGGAVIVVLIALKRRRSSAS